jgi:Predicted transcriptional regulator
MNSEFTIAVHCLIILANAPGQIWNSETLAGKVHTHPARVRKIMSLLRRNCLIMTKEGLGGGYRLACDPNSCSLAEIYRITACSALRLNWCSDSADKADKTERSGIRQALERTFSGAEHVLENYLSKQSIGSLLRELQEKSGTFSAGKTVLSTVNSFSGK